jgi:hypothetical protein
VSDSPLKDALAKIEDLPANEAEIGVVASRDGGVGAFGQVSTTLGKGWSVGARGEIVHRTGWKLAAIARWKG